MSTKRFKIDKLIRDRLPEIMRSSGITVSERTMGRDEYILRLNDKLIEETQEVIVAISTHELLEELADLSEVMYALAQANGISMEQIEEARLAKKAKKGGFEKRIYSAFVEMPVDHVSVDYYLARSDQYPGEDVFSKQS